MGSGKIRTGIDLGTGSVKLVRGQGTSRLERVTHAGTERWDPEDTGDALARASSALDRLLQRLKLGRGKLGSIAVATTSPELSLRVVDMPTLSQEELRRALPFEAKKHLALEEMASPVLSFQVLGPAPPAEEGGPSQIRVLFTAISGPAREFTLSVLDSVGLEPEVVDLEPLAALNALLATVQSSNGDSPGAYGLLDLGAQQSQLHLSQADGWVLTRSIGKGIGDLTNESSISNHVASLVRPIQETATHYRGRYRAAVSRLHLCGGGGLVSGIASSLTDWLEMPVSVLDPLDGLAKNAKGLEDDATIGPQLVTAYGLCRWWDDLNV